MIPTKLTFSKFSQPRITNHIKWFTSRKQHSYNHIRLTNLPEGWFKYYNLKKQCQRECHLAFNKYISTLVDPNSSAISKKLWPYIKSLKQEYSEVGLLNHQGTTITDPTAKANVLADYFSSVFIQEDASYTPNIDSGTLPNISPIQIHLEGEIQLLRNIQAHKQVDLTIFLPASSKKWLMKYLLF